MDFSLDRQEARNVEAGLSLFFPRKTSDAENETADRVEYGTTSHLLAFDKTRRVDGGVDGGRLIPKPLTSRLHSSIKMIRLLRNVQSRDNPSKKEKKVPECHSALKLRRNFIWVTLFLR